jgi:hypothetical protein
MALPGVRHVGERVYADVAANRSRYFVCSFDPDPAGPPTGIAPTHSPDSVHWAVSDERDPSGDD